MSIELLKDSLDKDLSADQIVLLAFVLGHPIIRKCITWNKLAKSFFQQFRKTILGYCGYDTGPLNIERIKVNHPHLFIEYLAGMLRGEMFDDCSYEKLAKFINMIFQTNYSESYICNLLKAGNEDFSHIHGAIKHEIKQAEKQLIEGESGKK